MKISITGRHLEISEAARAQIERQTGASIGCRTTARLGQCALAGRGVNRSKPRFMRAPITCCMPLGARGCRPGCVARPRRSATGAEAGRRWKTRAARPRPSRQAAVKRPRCRPARVRAGPRRELTPRPRSLLPVRGLGRPVHRRHRPVRGAGKSQAIRALEDLGFFLRRQPAHRHPDVRDLATSAARQPGSVGADYRQEAALSGFASKRRRTADIPRAAQLIFPRRSSRSSSGVSARRAARIPWAEKPNGGRGVAGRAPGARHCVSGATIRHGRLERARPAPRHLRVCPPGASAASPLTVNVPSFVVKHGVPSRMPTSGCLTCARFAEPAFRAETAVRSAARNARVARPAMRADGRADILRVSRPRSSSSCCRIIAEGKSSPRWRSMHRRAAPLGRDCRSPWPASSDKGPGRHAAGQAPTSTRNMAWSRVMTAPAGEVVVTHGQLQAGCRTPRR